MIQDPAAARRYAQALVTLAHRRGELAAALRDLEAAQQVIESQPSLAQFLANPEIAADEKQGLLTKVFANQLSPLALHLLLLLLWKGRLGLLPLILVEAQQLMDEVQGVARGVVRTVRPMSKVLFERLREGFERRLQKRVVLTTAIDPALIGGIVVHLESLAYDGSVRRELDLLRERLLATTCA